MDTPPIEKFLGMELYSTEFPGIGGKLKVRFEDFAVEEITPDLKTLTIQDWTEFKETDHAPAGEPNRFVTFTLQKMGLSTLDVAYILASSLKLSRKQVTYAGLKDKRAITSQSMSIPTKALDSLSSLELSRIGIRDIHYTRHPVQIGDLWGNRFTILLRNITSDCDSAIEKAHELQRKHLLNYFGVQRFGLTRPITHLVGKALIKQDYEDAVRIMLSTTSDYESEDLTGVRLGLAESLTPTEKMIESFPEDMEYEKTVMNELMKHPGDFQRAVLKMPPRVLTLQVHAYQSYLFNRLLSTRVKSGMSVETPQEGDFLIKLDETHSGRDMWLFVTESTLEERQRQVETGQYGLALPILGYSTRLPETKLSDNIRGILRDDDIRLADFRNPRVKPLDSAGGLHLSSVDLSDLAASCSDDGLLVRFSLRRGSYATVVMRELMKNHPINRV